jgi:hypothetical protein
MKESYREGTANHPGPEPCEGGVRPHLKRWTGVSVGWVLSSEIACFRTPMLSDDQKAKRLRATNASV